MHSVSSPKPTPDALAVVVVGNDAQMEALPARPIQLAHACLGVGFDLVLPASLGDELAAEAALRAAAIRNGEPAVLCNCPLVRRRLLASGPELEPALISTITPAVAISRFVRATLGPRLASLTYVGHCPGARTPDFDFCFVPSEFLSFLAESGISLVEQPDWFDDRLTPDRRRFLSLPGGCPTGDVLWKQTPARELVSLEGNHLTLDLASQLLRHDSTLIDLAPALGCHCSGVTVASGPRVARLAVMSIEPPRASAPIVDTEPAMPLDWEGDARREPPRAVIGSDETAADQAPQPVAADVAPDSTRRRDAIAVTPPTAFAQPAPQKDVR